MACFWCTSLSLPAAVSFSCRVAPPLYFSHFLHPQIWHDEKTQQASLEKSHVGPEAHGFRVITQVGELCGVVDWIFDQWFSF